jgi:hypothetical protein
MELSFDEGLAGPEAVLAELLCLASDALFLTGLSMFITQGNRLN